MFFLVCVFLQVSFVNSCGFANECFNYVRRCPLSEVIVNMYTTFQKMELRPIDVFLITDAFN
jgi:hypothetical protein